MIVEKSRKICFIKYSEIFLGHPYEFGSSNQKIEVFKIIAISSLKNEIRLFYKTFLNPYKSLTVPKVLNMGPISFLKYEIIEIYDNFLSK